MKIGVTEYAKKLKITTRAITKRIATNESKGEPLHRGLFAVKLVEIEPWSSGRRYRLHLNTKKWSTL